ncbi:serine/threonine-protein kinase pim-1-like [Seriola lalandi dorsalis]|uniref:serine/threonine-protein kinase pim-1-like n=1 Tax=Seriola lalandi dorsalis TaxID=1841481 RepID=UPI000C6FB706|nr:serine/threonine-protein kinase pim-1-like [Seriola lalandi dorsalis]
MGKKTLDSTHETSKPTNSLGDNPNKRKVSTEQESHRRSRRSDRKPIEEAAEAKGTKRKATETETPSKRQRDGTTDADISNNTGESNKVSVNVTEAGDDFEDRYLQLDKLGEGGFGSVYAGKRKTDNLPVAIKHVPKADVESRPMVLNRRICMVPMEVFLMLKAAGGPESVGTSAVVSLLDWYEQEQEVLLVMERPLPCVDLLEYLQDNNGPLEEDVAKNIMRQLVEAAREMHSKGVFHRDLKSENILIETSSDGPRVRIIDFGCGCVVRRRPYRSFSGTSAYAPPEFYMDGTYEAGPTTVWQLGALLYEMLDGFKQFFTRKFLRKGIKISSRLSRDCQDFLKMCLVVIPEERTTLDQIHLHPWFT